MPQDDLKADIAAIRKNTTPWGLSSFIDGLLKGAGFVIGSAITVVTAGWLLAAFGLIPAFEEIAGILREALAR